MEISISKDVLSGAGEKPQGSREFTALLRAKCLFPSMQTEWLITAYNPNLWRDPESFFRSPSSPAYMCHTNRYINTK